MIERLDYLMNSIDYVVCTKRKRHIMGGMLMSISLLFGGLAFTILKLNEKGDEIEYEQN